MTPLEHDAQAKAVHNEQVKLTATFLNGMGIAIFAVGSATPVLLALQAPNEYNLPRFVIAFMLLLAAFATHWQARSVLKEMKP